MMIATLYLCGLLSLHSQNRVELLSGEQARSAIIDQAHDPFFDQLSPIDIEARLGQPVDDASIPQANELLKNRFRNAVIDWPPDAADRLHRACQNVLAAAQQQCPSLIPVRWQFVLTDGSEEAAAAYTRGNTIVLPIQKLHAEVGPGRLEKLIAHETCHVYGRTHPQTRAKLLARLGFRVVRPIQLHPAIDARKLTNPDSPIIDSIIEIQPTPGVNVPAALVLYAEPARFSPAMGGGVFRYLRFGLVAVADLGEGQFGIVGRKDQFPVVYTPDQVAGFHEKVGRNTRYILSPDEILADNIALAIAPAPGLPPTDPSIPADLARIINESDEPSLIQP
jgi:hypothetical protein